MAKQETKKYSRGEFLNLLRVVGIAYVLAGVKATIFDIPRLGVTAVDILSHPTILMGLLEAGRSADILMTGMDKNKEFVTTDIVLWEAVQNYEERTGKPVTFNYSNKRVSREEVILQMKRGSLGKMTVSQLWLAMGDDELKEGVKSEAARAVVAAAKDVTTRRVVESAAVDYQSFWDMVRAGGSGLGEEFLVKAGKKNLEIDFERQMVDPEIETLAGEVVKEYFGKVRQKLELKHQPVKRSEVLREFLEINQGDLGKALRDMAIFLKAMARNDPETGKFIKQTEKNKETVDRYTSLFKDEVSLVGNNWLEGQPLGVRFGQIGLDYHVWESISLLMYVQDDVVAMMEAGNALLSIGNWAKKYSEYLHVTKLTGIEKNLQDVVGVN